MLPGSCREAVYVIHQVVFVVEKVEVVLSPLPENVAINLLVGTLTVGVVEVEAGVVELGEIVFVKIIVVGKVTVDVEMDVIVAGVKVV